MRSETKNRKARSGSAIIEMTIAVPLLVSLFLGCFQFGYAFYLYNELTQAVRAGGRYASVRHYLSLTETPTADYINAVRNMVVYGHPEGGTVPVVRGLRPEHVTVQMMFEKNIPARVRVSIDNFSIGVFWDVVLRGKPWAEFVYLGVWG
ncbi:MAG TPA: pilus assembly protein [Bryobacteraceae bacterium]|nr:pilus assembly protein [Bryobacteraceae bacterium]HOL69914.1 pilus assembly protein [Bryobacteraceae bacterium]HOQ45852.1 pilus assembly protein [Bryobacteraceae bacterium]HPQ13722.1 pilus assembly protein [Bryobacteraceae bacterium]HPU70939.1 pilus assembly protein [Bryobacteraceae bacterium]